MTADPRQALYISDLDWTLLRSDGSLSPYSLSTLTGLIRDGLRFTVASARSCASIRPRLAGLPLSLPVVEFNGAFVSDLPSGRHHVVNALPPDIAEDLYSLLDDAGSTPFLSTYDGAADRLYYNHVFLRNRGMRWYLYHLQSERDPRLCFRDALHLGLRDQVVCLTAIDEPSRLTELETEIHRRHGTAVSIHCFENHYSPGWYWLTIHDARATKDQGVAGIKRLQGLEDCRLVVFGDEANDIGMFRMADEAYAVAGAVPELARHANAVIGSNDDDAVARWLAHRWEAGE